MRSRVCLVVSDILMRHLKLMKPFSQIGRWPIGLTQINENNFFKLYRMQGGQTQSQTHSIPIEIIMLRPDIITLTGYSNLMFKAFLGFHFLQGISLQYFQQINTIEIMLSYQQYWFHVFENHNYFFRAVTMLDTPLSSLALNLISIYFQVVSSMRKPFQ